MGRITGKSDPVENVVEIVLIGIFLFYPIGKYYFIDQVTGNFSTPGFIVILGYTIFMYQLGVMKGRQLERNGQDSIFG